MDTPPLHEVVRRLDRLERENRRLKLGGAPVLVALAVLAAAGARRADTPRVVEAERFVVRGADRKDRASLGVKGDLCALAFLDAAGAVRAAFNVDRKGSAMLSMLGEAGKAAASLSLADDVEPSLLLHGKDGASHVMVTPQLCVFKDSTGTTRTSLSVPPDGSPSLSFCDRNGHTRASLRLDADAGAPSFSLSDNEGNNRISLTAFEQLPVQIRVMDRSGKLIFQAPDPSPTPPRAD